MSPSPSLPPFPLPTHACLAQPFNPSRPRSEWLTIPEAPRPNDEPLPRFTLAQLQTYAGKLPAVFALGRKVVCAEVPPTHPFANIMKDLLSGKQVGHV